MSAETYKYFQPDPNLDSVYGGAAIQTIGGSDINPFTATVRRIFKNVNFQDNGTRHLCRLGQDGISNYWFRVSDLFYPEISSYLTATELSTVTSTAPSGFAERTQQAEYQPFPKPWTNVIVMGSSLDYGVGATTALKDAGWGQSIDSLEATVTWEDTNRTAYGSSFALMNIANGSSSWANTVAPYNTFTYREDLRYSQQTKTLPLTYGNNFFVYGMLHTNDMAYDLSLSTADCWARIQAQVNTFLNDHPNAILGLSTVIRRSEDATLNGRLDGVNDYIRDGYAGEGVHVLLDFDGDVPALSIASGDTTNTTYYSGDGVHLNTTGYGLLVPTITTAITIAKNLF